MTSTRRIRADEYFSTRAVRASKLATRGVGKVETDGSLAFQNEMFAQFRKRTGATVLTASSGVEFVFAEENGELGNGVFT